MDRLIELYFLPPMAIARLGGGETPADSFNWTETAIPTEGPHTRIEPAVSLRVEADGSVMPYVPATIVLKDAENAIRPVAPFFELWARLQSAQDGRAYEVAVTPAVLAEIGASLQDLRYEITAANRKAERRTGDAACSFVARAVVNGGDHAPHELLAFSPHTSGQEPLVFQDKPVPLGWFQVMRPIERTVRPNPEAPEVDCATLRLRFTPPKGLVYGPAEAMSAPAPEVPPGVYEDAATQFGRIHEIVAPERRILNGKTIWSRYIMMNGSFEDPPPQDGYDGAAVGDFRSWGCVDDTSDSVIQATLAVGGVRYRAVARVFAGPPDFAPDRRPVYSIADDIADRELPRMVVDGSTASESKAEVVDLFHRAFETASLLNLDAVRARALQENRIRFSWHTGPEGRDEPKARDESMTAQDQPYVNKLPILAPQSPSRFTQATQQNSLPYTTVVPLVHAQMIEEAVLLGFLRRRADHVQKVVRPAYARFGDLPAQPAEDANPKFRDPRVFRDQLHDMRMPPYMRDANLQPLSLSRRQYDELMDFVALLPSLPPGSLAAGADRRNKIFPRNLTARAERQVSGNPVTTRMESGVGNCFPGLEFDVRVLDCRFFPGLVFQYVTAPLYPADDAIPNQQGVRLLYTDWLLDPMLPETSGEPWVQELLRLYKGPLAKPRLTTGRWYLDWIEQDGKRVSMTDPQGNYYDGELAWRLVRCLEPNKQLDIGLVQRVGGDLHPRVQLKGFRRPYVNEAGVFDEAFRPGELTEAMCNPWTHDFRDCACHYWASNHPDVVLHELPTSSDLRAGAKAPQIYVNWLRVRGLGSEASAFATIAQNRPFQIDHYEINHMWQTLPFVLEGQEIDLAYQPSVSQDPRPYENDKQLIDELEGELGPMELALAIQYLYALFSLRDPDDPSDATIKAYPTLHDDLRAVREFVLMVAVSEMTHLRWVNQILWELDHSGHKPSGWKYEPVVNVSTHIKSIDKAPTLRPLTPEVLADFVYTERPQGSLTAAYGRCVATLRQKGYPTQALELALRIDGEGFGHYERFRRVQRILESYGPTADTYPYLRQIREAEANDPAVQSALGHFNQIRLYIRAAYRAEADGDPSAAQKNIDGARQTMGKFREEAEALARSGIGVPLLKGRPLDGQPT